MPATSKQKNDWAKQRMKKLRQEFGGRCYKCGSDQKLEFAHIKPTGLNGKSRGRNTRMYDIIRHPDCYQLMCYTCHLEFDSIHEEII